MERAALYRGRLDISATGNKVNGILANGLSQLQDIFPSGKRVPSQHGIPVLLNRKKLQLRSKVPGQGNPYL